VGFDREQATGQGLGLVSMEERLKLVKGSFTIETQPGGGVTIHARVAGGKRFRVGRVTALERGISPLSPVAMRNRAADDWKLAYLQARRERHPTIQD